MNLKSAFAGMKDAAELADAVPARAMPVVVREKLAKSVDPDFEPVKIYVRKQTRKAAWRNWEDAGGGDFSDLVEKLLREFLGR